MKSFFSGFWAQKKARGNFREGTGRQVIWETWKLKESGQTCERCMNTLDTWEYERVGGQHGQAGGGLLRKFKRAHEEISLLA